LCNGLVKLVEDARSFEYRSGARRCEDAGEWPVWPVTSRAQLLEPRLSTVARLPAAASKLNARVRVLRSCNHIAAADFQRPAGILFVTG